MVTAVSPVAKAPYVAVERLPTAVKYSLLQYPSWPEANRTLAHSPWESSRMVTSVPFGMVKRTE